VVVYAGLAAPVHLIRFRARARSEQRYATLIRRLADEHGNAVIAGPFVGMRLTLEQHPGSQLLPKLLGTYEQELHAELERLIDRGYQTIINVGCGEGYYAVGLALRNPSCEVFAFDIDSDAQRLCRMVAKLNGVDDRVHVSATCDHATLARLLTPASLVLVDCEGCELELLRPDLVSALKTADLIVETHDFIRPSISQEIANRFADTHRRSTLDAQARDSSSMPALRHLRRGDRHRAACEKRPPMQWFVLEARRS